MSRRYSSDIAVNLDVHKLTETSLDDGRRSSRNESVGMRSSPLGDEGKSAGLCPNQPSLFHISFPEIVDKGNLFDQSGNPSLLLFHPEMDTSSRLSEPTNTVGSFPIPLNLSPLARPYSGSRSMHSLSSSGTGRIRSRPVVSREHKMSETRLGEVQKLKKSMNMSATSPQLVKKREHCFPNVWQNILKCREEKELRKAKSAVTQIESSEEEGDSQVTTLTVEESENKPVEPENQESESLESVATPRPEKVDLHCQGDIRWEPSVKEKKPRKGTSLLATPKTSNQRSRQLTEVVYPPYSLNPELAALSSQAMNSLKAIEFEVKGGAGDIGKSPHQRTKNLHQTKGAECGDLVPQIELSRSRLKGRPGKSKSATVSRQRPRPVQAQAKRCPVSTTPADRPKKAAEQKLPGPGKDGSTIVLKKHATLPRGRTGRSAGQTESDVTSECQRKGYEVLRKIWRGRVRPYSQIYLANNLNNLEFCPVEITAIKQPYARFTSSVLTLRQSRAKRWYTHNWVNVLPTHDNLVKLLHRFYTSSWLYHVTEHCAWPSLTHLIHTTSCGSVGAAPRGLREDACRAVFRQICQGMDHLHSHGIVHGDLNCCNVLVTNDLRVKLAGYGPTCQRMMTVLESLCGHLNVQGEAYDIYAPPEMMTRRNTWTKCCDVWSMGITLLQMAIGAIPPEVNAAVRLNSSSRTLERFGLTDCGYQLCRLIGKILQARPTCRPTVWTISQHTWLLDGRDLVTSMKTLSKNHKRTDGTTFPLPKRLQGRMLRTSDAIYACGSRVGDYDCAAVDDAEGKGESRAKEDRNNHGGFADVPSSSASETEKKKNHGRPDYVGITMADHSSSVPDQPKTGSDVRCKTKRKTKERGEKKLNVHEKPEGKKKGRDSERARFSKGRAETEETDRVIMERSPEVYCDMVTMETAGNGDTEGVPCNKTAKGNGCLLLKLVENMLEEEHDSSSTSNSLSCPSDFHNLGTQVGIGRDMRKLVHSSVGRRSMEKSRKVVGERPGNSTETPDRKPKVDKFKDLLVIGKSTNITTVHLGAQTSQGDEEEKSEGGRILHVEEMKQRFQNFKSFEMNFKTQDQGPSEPISSVISLNGAELSLIDVSRVASQSGAGLVSDIQSGRDLDNMSATSSHGKLINNLSDKTHDQLSSITNLPDLKPQSNATGRLDGWLEEAESNKAPPPDLYFDATYTDTDGEQIQRQSFIDDEEQAMQEMENMIAVEGHLYQDNLLKSGPDLEGQESDKEGQGSDLERQ